MLPPGRRRNGTAALFALFCLLTTTASAASAVLGLDFGTQHLKAALVKPGIPFDIVLTKDSKRKETAAVAFKPTRDGKNNIVAEVGSYPERSYGGDALATQGRVPGEVFPNLKPLLGLPWDDEEGASQVVEVYRSRYPAVQAEQVREMGTVMFKSAAFAEKEAPWAVEELLAMQLANVRRNAEGMAGKGTSVVDAVITVPAFYTADERRAIERAATLAGLDVNALITDGLAVGMDYAKSRTFPDVSKGERPEHHLVFDMGAGSTTATLLRFQSRSVKDVGRFNKTVQEVAVLGAGWDRTLGGDAFTQVVLDSYVHKLLTKPVLKSRGTKPEEIKANGRLMSRLWKDVEKARQVLSANTETSSSFEEILPEIDFRTKLSRNEFEDMMTDFADRVAQPILDALAAAKLDIEDVDSVILHGGAVRTPFVQRKLEEVAGAAKLRSNVNADESAVFGAVFKGAGLSPSFKVKEIRDSDIAIYAAGMMYTDGGKERKQQLFTATSPVGNGAATKSVTFKNKDDFTFDLYQIVDGKERPFARIETNNLTAGVKDLKDKFGCEKEEVNTKFSIRLSAVDGLPEVLVGSVSCEVEGTGKSGSVVDSVKGWFGGKKDQEPLKEDDDADVGPVEEVDATSTSASRSAASESGSAASSSSSPKPASDKPKKRTESLAIAFNVLPTGLPQPSPEEMKRMRDRLAAFDRADGARLRREEALNVLESYTYFVRDFLDNADYVPYAASPAREGITGMLAKVRDFMEGDAARATEEVLRERLADLKGLVEPIRERRKETEARPEKLEALRSSLQQTETFIDNMKEAMIKAEAAQASQSAEAAKASSASTTSAEADAGTTASPSAEDDLADLEEADSSSSSTTSSASPKATEIVSPYTAAELEQIQKVHDDAAAWLKEKEAAQEKLQDSDDPAFTVKDLERESSKLSKIMTDMIYKQMQRQAPPKKSSTKSKTKSKTNKGGKKGKSTTTVPGDEDATATGSGKPAFVTINPSDGMPSEEEIMRMVREAQANGAGREEEAEVPAESGHEEL
jgi:hypoxia up-regulated 1